MTTDTHLSDWLRNRLEQGAMRRTEPSVSLLQGMRYVPAAHTDIRATLDRARRAIRTAAPIAKAD